MILNHCQRTAKQTRESNLLHKHQRGKGLSKVPVSLEVPADPDSLLRP